jgi:hypothetical protein
MKKVILLTLMLCALCAGCNSVASFFGADVVTDRIKEADQIRHKYTVDYIDATLPLVEKHMSEADKIKYKTVGTKLKAISDKENKLIQGTWKED